jgi:hypothetical protein
MKKLFLLLVIFIASKSHAQLNKGAQIAGIQFNLAVHDIYYSRFNIGNNRFGLSLVPTYGYAIQNNWLIGLQATIGYQRIKSAEFTSFAQTVHYTDLGIAPFTRYYLDLTPNKKFKFYGLAALELNHAITKFTYTGGSAPATTSSSHTGVAGSIGAGLAYFGRKTGFDISGSTTAVRFGVYRIIGAKK